MKQQPTVNRQQPALKQQPTTLKQQSSVKGFAVLSMASMICKILSLAYLPFQTMIVGDIGNGIISKGYNLYVFIYSLTNAGLPVVISKFVSERLTVGDERGARRTFRCALTLMLAFGAGATLLTWLGADWIANSFSNQPRTAMMFRTIAPTFLFTAVAGSLRGYFQGRQNMTPTAVSQVIEQVLNSFLTVTFIKLFFDYAARIQADSQAYAAAGSALATVVAAAGSAAFLLFLFTADSRRQRLSGLRPAASGQHGQAGPSTGEIYRRLLVFTVPAVISAIAASGIDLIDVKSTTQMLQVAGFSPDQASALFGIYSTKYQKLFAIAAITFSTPLATSMIPALSAALAQGNRKLFLHKVREGYRLIFLTVMPIIAGFSFLAQPVLTLVFFRQNAGAPLLVFGMWFAVLNTIQVVQSGILIAMGHPLVSPATTIIGMLAKLACNYLLIRIPSINIYGALIGNAVTWIIVMSLNQMFIQRQLGLKIRLFRHLRSPAIAALIMGAVCLGVFELLYAGLGLVLPRGVLLNDLILMVTIAVGAFVYAFLVIGSGMIKGEDILKLPLGTRLYAVLRRLPLIRTRLA